MQAKPCADGCAHKACARDRVAVRVGVCEWEIQPKPKPPARSQTLHSKIHDRFK